VSRNIATSAAGQGGALKGTRRRTAAAAHILVEYADTADMPDGQPLPPYFDSNGAIWRIVRRLGARTRWRRIRLSAETSAKTSEHAIDRRLVARTSSAWRQKPRHQNQ
jgi:hypothetical protein